MVISKAQRAKILFHCKISIPFISEKYTEWLTPEVGSLCLEVYYLPLQFNLLYCCETPN